MVVDGRRSTATGRQWSLAREAYRWLLRNWIRLTMRDHRRMHIVAFQGLDLVILPGVFDGVRLRTGAFLAEVLAGESIGAGARVLDLGTGSGIGALVAARSSAHVVATDISPDAVRCARINAIAHHLEIQIETRVGDLYEPVADETFDLILFNPPFYHGRARDREDAAWRSPDAFERFLRELRRHLTESGRALVVLSTDDDISSALGSARSLAVRPVRRKDLVNEILTVYEIRAAK